MKISMASEIEFLTSSFSKTSRDLIVMTHKYEEKSKYLGMYYEKSEKYIKNREDELTKVQAECDRLGSEYGRFDRMFQEERTMKEKFQEDLRILNEEHAAL